MKTHNGINILPPRPKAKSFVKPPFDQAPKRNPRRQCWGKMRHSSREAALAHVRRIGPEVRAYACPWCAKWHVGNSNETFVTSIWIPPAK